MRRERGRRGRSASWRERRHAGAARDGGVTRAAGVGGRAIAARRQLPCLQASWIALAACFGVMLPPAISAVASFTTRPTEGPSA